MSKYTRYKRATAFFLDWLLLARGRGRHAGRRVKLSAISDVVQEIAAAPGSSLTPKLLQTLPKALAACQCAITLRQHATAFFSGGDRGHQHFLQLLRGWHETLQSVLHTQHQDEDTESKRFENYYQVLQVDEDYFPDDELFVAEPDAHTEAKVDREQLFNEAFAEDLRLEVVYFFLELEELVEGVFNIYDQVKKQQRTMVEATVVVKLAMVTAAALTARLQLKYPALKTAEDVLSIVMEKTPRDYLKKMAKAVTDSWTKFQNNGTFTFVPGMLIVDFMSVGSTLASFTPVIPTQARTQLIVRDGFFGEVYGEDRTPQYVLPDPSNMVVFLLQQLPMLFNAILAMKEATGSTFDDSNLTSSFLALMDEYFTSRQVTVPVVFVCICWLKAVAALQGEAGLTRNVSLTFKHTKDLMKNMEATVAKGAVFTADREIHNGLKQCAEEIKMTSRGHNLARANPLMAGFLMMTYNFHYLYMASEILMVTSRFRAFGHLYNALVEQGFLQHIPFFDDVLEIYEEMIFTPSRAAAVHGSYNRTYLLSSHLTATAVNAMYRGVAPPTGKEAVKVRKALHFRDLSKIYRLLHENDKSMLGGASSKAMLNNAADICSKELFQTRVLSRDILKLNDDLTDVFSDMCDALGQRQYHDDYIARPKRGESHHYRVNSALENSVMIPLMPLLDCLQSDGSLDLNMIPTEYRVVQLDILGGEGVKILCRKAAAVIKAKFATPPLVCERKYFTFPSKPDFIDQEYGTASSMRTTEGQERAQLFSDLMSLLEDSSGPLSMWDLNKLKSELRKDPSLLSMGSRYRDPSAGHGLTATTNSMLDDSLFHQAAAGPAHDVELVEWMIQLGALTIQPLHCRKTKLQLRNLLFRLDTLPNTMAIHSAAMAGHDDIVRVILEADNMVDLNTPTFHTKETLAHLAVKHGHRSLFKMLVVFGADVRIKDSNGKRVCDVTNDRQWRREITASIDQIERSQAACEGARNRDALFRHQGNLRAERLRQSVSAQRDEERQRALENANTNTVAGSKKNNKKKKKGKKGKKGNAPAPAASPPAATGGDLMEMSNLLTDLLVTAGAEMDASDDPEQFSSLENSLENTAAAFARLRDPSIPATDKADDVQHACKVIKKLESSVEASSHPSRLNSTDRRVRIAISSEALQVIHMMQKFHRVDHAAVAAPALAPVRKLCNTTMAFTRFVVGTAHLSVSVDRKPQAREILDVLEKRLVKTPIDKREPGEYRELVQTYSTARDAMGLGKTSSPDTFRALEWYLSNTVDRFKVQAALDRFVGRPMYLEFTATPAITPRQFSRFEAAVDTVPELDGVVCFDRRVLYGATDFEDLMRVLRSIGDLGLREKMHFAAESMQIAVTTMYVGKFVLSEDGVVSNTP
ncbi:hypothetical protein PF008_g3582 [Phytophthora fragariae]|uniref:DUF6604 domain-containing protein n=1 Tax=Phytophthora fragariae TaxID=53985 RepID=A0A6G0SDS6_9STRA|nr:hypothetical protein PF008_g3582 [Phytophthora fragariae]